MPWKDKEIHNSYCRFKAALIRALYLYDKVCAKCDSIENLEIDHIDPDTKIDHRIWSWSEQHRSEELLKCQVLCRNCHKAKHRPPIIHGTRTGYKNRGCRCIECTKANTEYSRKLRLHHLMVKDTRLSL